MVRSAVEDDIKDINQLGKIIHPKFDTLFSISDILNEKFSKIYVCEEDHHVIGFIHVTILYETMDIVNIVVAPEYQNRGIGSLLIDYVMSEISQEVQLMTLEVNVNNHNAIKLYEKFGFEVINERKNYYDGKENAYLMGRKLGE